ncbi:hypothetical protein RJZ56_004415 [Blastomyces dermatitidis]|uniref:Protein ARV n=2 Tax=Ajellomyces dermatitidis TaxID=5039 RepID=F2TPP4_AJEDA|nr:protein arv1 [Blastomyces dermatitidis ER-3]EEQ91266.1 protein arv1 [Blastomyces dermatitidis ER-3]EGE85207.1 arv1 [Blastomyces dermatitidis ATCC 18188]EQL31352.1 hypothetical protein BDFG_06296 [Blastomyces dermatitidis ATCC 26199]
MPICIECCCPVSHLYTSYSKADDRSLGKGVRLTQCPRCKRFADKYVEHDFVVLFIDLVLIKPQVYRHLLFNRLGRSDNKFDRSIIRLGTLILLFDVYLSWARVEKSDALSASPLSTAPIIVQYIFFLTLNTLATIAHHVTVRLLASFLVPRPQPITTTLNDANNGDVIPPSPSVTSAPSQSQPQNQVPTANAASNNGAVPPPPSSNQPNHNSTNNLPTPPPPIRRMSASPLQIDPMPPPCPASPNSISTALLVSSCTKLFPILLVIWSPETHDANGNVASTTPASALGTATRMLANLLASTVTKYISPSSSSISTVPQQQQQLQLTSSPSPSSISAPTSTSSSLSTSILDPLLSLVLSITNTHLVLLNNTEALFILLDCGYIRAAILALSGQLARWLVEKTLLGAVGL